MASRGHPQRASSARYPASNRFVTLHGVHFVELTDGRVRRARGFFDLYDARHPARPAAGRGGLGEAALLLLRGFGFGARLRYSTVTVPAWPGWIVQT